MKKTTRPVKPVVVETEKICLGSVTEWVVGEGRAEAVRKQHLQFEVSGKIVFIAKANDGAAIREGSYVKGPDNGKGEKTKGQLLAALDCRNYTSTILQRKAAYSEAQHVVKVKESALIQSQNSLNEIKSDYERKKSLFDKKVLAQCTFEQTEVRYRNAIEELATARYNLEVAKANVLSTRAELNKAERNLEKASIYAPFSGIISRINIKEGSYCTIDSVDHMNKEEYLETTPLTILDTSCMEITMNLPEYQGCKVKVGQAVVIVPGGEDWFRKGLRKDSRETRGVVYSVSPSINISSRAIRVKVRMEQPGEYRIMDGMFVTCWIAANVASDVLRIPFKCLLFSNDTAYAYVYEKGTARRRKLKLGVIDSKYAEITSGLKENDLVITRGRREISDGQLVRISKREKEGKNGLQK